MEKSLATVAAGLISLELEVFPLPTWCSLALLESSWEASGQAGPPRHHLPPYHFTPCQPHLPCGFFYQSLSSVAPIEDCMDC